MDVHPIYQRMEIDRLPRLPYLRCWTGHSHIGYDYCRSQLSSSDQRGEGERTQTSDLGHLQQAETSLLFWMVLVVDIYPSRADEPDLHCRLGKGLLELLQAKD